MELVNVADIANVVYSNRPTEARVWMTHWASEGLHGACQCCRYNKCIFQWAHQGSCVDDPMGLGEFIELVNVVDIAHIFP